MEGRAEVMRAPAFLASSIRKSWIFWRSGSGEEEEAIANACRKGKGVSLSRSGG